MPSVDEIVDQALGTAQLQLLERQAQLDEVLSRADEEKRKVVAALGVRRMTAVEVSVIVPTLDTGSDHYHRCIESLRIELAHVPHEIIIKDGPITEWFTDKINTGIAEAKGAYLVSHNDDVEVLEGWWPPLKAAIDAGAHVVFPKTIEGFMRHDLTGWCYAFDRVTLARHRHSLTEWLDPGMRVTYSDTDLLMRLRQAGDPPVCVPQSRVRHGLSQTLKRVDYAEQEQLDRAAFEAKWHTVATPL